MNLSAMKLQSLARITIEIEPEEISIRGNCMASGDDEFDEKCAKEIEAQLDSGNLWAWCTVTVRAEYAGVTGYANLGACSYSSGNEFRKDGYFHDMQIEAIEDLDRRLVFTSREIMALSMEG